ncbi:hypothetical protein JTE90_004302 [Oedothorax gibbosus]|uniref:BRISC and BRCA1-A complex member 1 n=1 Tax=Oedothorax gibbosus TaxID=931172 RepID=A0AAV6VLY1_9ARAC|nr:hypothetical protein JTE90_004302 [Oedothorax gibbosus]
MSASGDGLPVKISNYVEENAKLKTPSRETVETPDISPELFAQQCAIFSPEDEESGQITSDKSELTDSVPLQAEAECVNSRSSIETNEEQTDPTHIEDSSSSPSNSSSGRFRRSMHYTVPKINFAEKIVFCLDMSSDMEDIPFKLGDRSQHSPLSMVKRTIQLFVENKHFINRKHEFSLMVLYENATWVREFTNDPKELIDSLQDLTETQACNTCDLASIVTLITEKCEIRIPRKVSLLPCIFRIILVYGRSRCMFHFSSDEAREFLINYPFFILDIVYIHEPPSSENKCQEIFEALCDLDEHDKSYIFEVTRNTTKLHNSMAKLLTHPIQRCAQKDSSYSIRTPFLQDLE